VNEVNPDQGSSLSIGRRWPIQARVWLEWARGGSCLSGLFKSAALNSIRNRRPTPGRRRLDTALHRMRDRYNFPTNEALIAAAVKLERIPLAIDTTDDPKCRRD
jgi:hypothetical protein